MDPFLKNDTRKLILLAALFAPNSFSGDVLSPCSSIVSLNIRKHQNPSASPLWRQWAEENRILLWGFFCPMEISYTGIISNDSEAHKSSNLAEDKIAFHLLREYTICLAVLLHSNNIERYNWRQNISKQRGKETVFLFICSAQFPGSWAARPLQAGWWYLWSCCSRGACGCAWVTDSVYTADGLETKGQKRNMITNYWHTRGRESELSTFISPLRRVWLICSVKWAEW